MSFVNESGIIGTAITGVTQHVTGDINTSLVAILFILLIWFVGMGIPTEWSAIIIVPLLITGVAYTSELGLFTGLALMYLGVLLAKYYFTNQ